MKDAMKRDTGKKTRQLSLLDLTAILASAAASVLPTSVWHESRHARGHDPKEKTKRVARRRRGNHLAKMSRRRNRS